MLAIEISKNKNDQTIKKIISELEKCENKESMKSSVKEENLTNLSNVINSTINSTKDSNDLLNLISRCITEMTTIKNKNNNEKYNTIINNKNNNERSNNVDTEESNIADSPSLLIINALKQNNVEKAIQILDQPNVNINQLYNGKTIMSFMIENNIDNELIYNILFKKKAYISDVYFNKHNYKLILNNSGLINSIRNGFYVKEQSNFVGLIKSPLIYFIKNTRNKITEKLLENNASIEEIDDKTGFTPLFQAINSKNYEIFSILINKYNPDITKMDNNKRTPLELAKSIGIKKFISDLENYIENNKKLNSIVKPMQQSFTLSNTITTTNILSEKINNINENNINSNNDKSNIVDNPSLLILNALEQNNNIEEAIQILNQPNININQLYNGKTIMSFMIENNINNELIYNILFKKKAYISDIYFNIHNYELIVNNSGLIKSIRNGFYVKKQSNNSISFIDKPLIYFIKNSRDNIVKKLLENNASIDEMDKNTGFTPIFQAIQCRNYEIFSILINKYHPNITIKDFMKRTPLMLAKEKAEKSGYDEKMCKIISELESYNSTTTTTANNTDNSNTKNISKKVLKKTRSLREIKEDRLITEIPKYNEIIPENNNIINNYLDSGVIVNSNYCEENTKSLFIIDEDSISDTDNSLSFISQKNNHFNNDSEDSEDSEDDDGAVINDDDVYLYLNQINKYKYK